MPCPSRACHGMPLRNRRSAMNRPAAAILILGILSVPVRLDARPDAPAASPRTAEVCDGCREKAEGPAIAVIGPCAFCKDGYTPSPVFKACAACAAKRGICRVCLKPMGDAGPGGVVSSEPSDGGAGEPGAVGGAGPGAAAPEPAGDRVPGFCDDCQERARGPIIESSAQCSVCKDGWTASGMFRVCDACAEKRRLCKMCAKPLKGSSPMKPAAGGAGKPGSVEKGPKRTIEQVKETHGDDLMALRGVVGNGIGESKGRPALILYVETKEDARRLDALLSDEIEGYPLRIVVSGAIKAK